MALNINGLDFQEMPGAYLEKAAAALLNKSEVPKISGPERDMWNDVGGYSIVD